MPAWLHTIAELNTPTPVVGVAIARPNRENEQLHCGVIYKEEYTPNTSFLHLAFHARLCLDHPFNSPQYKWVALQIDELRMPAVIALCQRIWKRGRDIPYGVLYSGGQFISDGRLDLSAGGHGLTCATFVMAVFQSAGIELLEWWTWPSRPEDALWHQQVVSALQYFRAHYPEEISEDHIRNVNEELGCARFHPEEVTGSCSSMDLGYPF